LLHLTSKNRPGISGVTFRGAAAADVPRMTELIAAAALPAVFITEFLDGFVVAERGGEVIACGGVEHYGACAVIRSVVVDPSARGLGVGVEIAGMLMDRARAAAAQDIYLFTAEAQDFWSRLGFVDVTFEEWKEPARACWQYQFLSPNREMLPDVHPMWRSAAP